MKTTITITCAILILMFVGFGLTEAQTVSSSIGILPAGKSVTLTYDVRVKNPVANHVTQVGTQGSVSGSNFATVLTNDPDTGAPNDSTKTPVVSAPNVVSFAPTSGMPGSPVTINGSHFTGATGVAFNGVPVDSFTVVPPGTQITTVVPNAASTGKVSVTGPGGTTQSTDDYTVIPLPIQLASFTGYEIPGSGVLLRWTTVSEINNYGFNVYRRIEAQPDFSELPNSFIPGHGTTNEPQHYEFRDASATAAQWYYRLKQTDLDGTIHFTDPIQVSVLTAVKNDIAPREFSLSQNYPNPFNPSTQIKFSVEATGHAQLDVFNILGQRVVTLYNDIAEAGVYHTVRFDATSLSSGMYFYRLQSGTKTQLKKLMLLK